MKSAYPGFSQLECASIFRKLKSSNNQSIFEIMNFIHREISIQITLNEADNRADNRNKKEYLLPIDPYEIIDPIYNNPEHIKVMKYYHIYNSSDADKLPPFINKMITKDFYYTSDANKRRKVLKYPDGSFNYIPIRCENQNCNNQNCIYSHNDDEMSYHPLYYKTKYYSQGKGILEKTANNLLEDFRIIYNYKNENIIKLLKLLDEYKIARTSFKEYFKNKITCFELETFKTLECPSIKSGISCKKDPHLCYYYHNISEKRRPPTLYCYTNEMCPNQSIKENRIKKSCKNGDFCNLCHSRYEYYYHKLLFGKAMTCLRKKKNGKCIYEETCYAYHPYKEPGYKKTKEEIIQEKKDELLDKYKEEYELLSGLISHYKCQNCEKYNKKFKFYLLTNCGHIICLKCFEEKAKKKGKCPKCKEKFDVDNKEECIEMDIKSSAKDIDKLIKKNYEEKLKNEKKEEEKKDENNENKENNKKEEKADKNNEKEKEKSDDDNNNNSMG